MNTNLSDDIKKLFPPEPEEPEMVVSPLDVSQIFAMNADDLAYWELTGERDGIFKELFIIAGKPNTEEYRRLWGITKTTTDTTDK